MSDPLAIAIVGSVTTVVVSVVNMVLAIQTRERGKRNEDHLISLKDQTDGLSEKLVKATGESEFARGLKQGEDNPR